MVSPSPSESLGSAAQLSKLDNTRGCRCLILQLYANDGDSRVALLAARFGRLDCSLLLGGAYASRVVCAHLRWSSRVLRAQKPPGEVGSASSTDLGVVRCT